MKTFPKVDEGSGRTLGFEVENVYVSPSTVARILGGVEGVEGISKRRPFSSFDEIHVRFLYQGVECVVWEPFGDNSRYWLGQKDSPDPVDMTKVEEAFRNYLPPFHRKVIGDIATLQFLKWFAGRAG